MQKNIIGILSIGSGVGQSIIESLRLSNHNFYTIGLGNNPLAFGAYECDEMMLIPSFFDSNYVDSLLNLCMERSVKLLIPGTDDEALILSYNTDIFLQNDIRIIVSKSSFMALIRDKKNLSIMFKNSSIFLASYNLEETISLINRKKIQFPLIAKPKDGNASNGIKVLLNETDFTLVTEKDVIQECAVPHKKDVNYTQYIAQIKNHINPQISEYSFQIVLNQNGDEIGRMVSYNKLRNGVPIEIIPSFQSAIWEEVNRIIPELKSLGARGPINIQGRLTDHGLKCFEINARFTGITGLRAELGFNEVEKLVLDYLNVDNTVKLLVNPNKIGIRQTTNKSIYDKKYNHLQILRTPQNAYKTVLITGANGYLGSHIIKQLDNRIYKIIAQVRDIQTKMKILNSYPKIEVITLSELKNGDFNFGQVDTVIHTLFALPHRINIDTQESLEFTQWLLVQTSKFHIPEFINISSFSVYGYLLKSYPNINCDTFYSQAKYSTELMVNTMKNLNPHLKYINLRLSTLIGQYYHNEPLDLITKWIVKTIKSETIQLTINNEINRLDVNDAARGVIKLMENIQNSDRLTYDLASPFSYSLIEILDKITKIANKLNYPSPLIEVETNINEHKKLFINLSSFYKLTNWLPEIVIDETITQLFINYQENIYNNII